MDPVGCGTASQAGNGKRNQKIRGCQSNRKVFSPLLRQPRLSCPCEPSHSTGHFLLKEYNFIRKNNLDFFLRNMVGVKEAEAQDLV